MVSFFGFIWCGWWVTVIEKNFTFLLAYDCDMIVVSGECMWVGFGMGMDDDDGNKKKELMKSKTMKNES